MPGAGRDGAEKEEKTVFKRSYYGKFRRGKSALDEETPNTNKKEDHESELKKEMVPIITKFMEEKKNQTVSVRWNN